MQQVDLVRVQHENVMAVNTEVQRSSQCTLSMKEVLRNTRRVSRHWKIEWPVQARNLREC